MPKIFKDLLNSLRKHIVDNFIAAIISSAFSVGIFVWFNNILKIGFPLSYLIVIILILSIILCSLLIRALSLSKNLNNGRCSESTYVEFEFKQGFVPKSYSNAELDVFESMYENDAKNYFKMLINFDKPIKGRILSIKPETSYEQHRLTSKYAYIHLKNIKTNTYRIDIR